MGWRLTQIFALSAVLAGCSAGSAAFSVQSVEPPSWPVGAVPTLTIHGRGFLLAVDADLNGERVTLDDGFFADVGGMPLVDCTWVTPTELIATAVSSIPVGTHDLSVGRPDGRVTVLAGAVTVTDGTAQDGGDPGDPMPGDPGDPTPGDPGDPAGDPLGDAAGDPWMGDAAGDPWMGDAAGDAWMGDAAGDAAGDAWMGDPMGDPGAGDFDNPLAEDFEDGVPPEFAPGIVGDWSVSDGVLQQTDSCAPQHDAFLSNDQWEDVEVSGDVRIDSVCPGGYQQAGLIVRGQSLGDCGALRYISCVLDVDRDEVALGVYNHSCSATGNWSGADTIVTDVWYRMTLRAEGINISCTLDGPTLSSPLTTVYSDFNAVPGSVGFNGDGAAASWDNVAINPL